MLSNKAQSQKYLTKKWEIQRNDWYYLHRKGFPLITFVLISACICSFSKLITFVKKTENRRKYCWDKCVHGAQVKNTFSFFFSSTITSINNSYFYNHWSKQKRSSRKCSNFSHLTASCTSSIYIKNIFVVLPRLKHVQSPGDDMDLDSSHTPVKAKAMLSA